MWKYFLGLYIVITAIVAIWNVVEYIMFLKNKRYDRYFDSIRYEVIDDVNRAYLVCVVIVSTIALGVLVGELI